jgi:glycosyltransferase involved in cell wall biosynthesis
VLEAMSTGTIPVVNSLSSFQSFIQDRQNGFLTNFADVQEAAQVIVHVLSLENKDLSAFGQKAKESAARFDWDIKVESFIEVYECLCSP